MYIPFPLINIIMKYMGAYNTSSKRPYLKTIKLLSDVILIKGIGNTFIYIKEMNELTKIYFNTNNWIFRYYN